MVEELKIIWVCPECGQYLVNVVNEGIFFQNCEHYEWWSNLGGLSSEELKMKGVKLLLSKR
jgi:hypothetical protein